MRYNKYFTYLFVFILFPTEKLRKKLNGIAPYNAKGFKLSFRLTEPAKYNSMMQIVSILFMRV